MKERIERVQANMPESDVILLIEPHPIVSYAIVDLIQRGCPHPLRIHHVDHGLKALQAFRLLRPRLTILSSELPGLSVEDVVTQIFQREKAAKLLIYANSQEFPSLQTLLKQGVQGVVLKTQPATHLLEAIQKLLSNKSYIDEKLQPRGLNQNGRNAKRQLELPHLSPRERQILKLVAEGLKNREISCNFSISIKTVETHRLNLMRKLDAHHIVDLVRWARWYRLIAA